jgi:acetoin utilization protein AcuB
MLVSDVMSTNVVSIPSYTSLAEAARIFEAHRIRRLPVVDRGKLVGLVAKDALDKAGPSQLTTFSMHEIAYLLDSITVREIMRKDVVTVAPEMTVEAAVALAQSNKVGALVVMEGERVVGIVTTNDFFYGLLNPLLGLGMPGSRITVRDCYQGSDLEKVITVINKLGVEITNILATPFPKAQKRDLMIHLNTDDNTRVVEEIEKLGYSVEKRER